MWALTSTEKQGGVTDLHRCCSQAEAHLSVPQLILVSPKSLLFPFTDMDTEV